jgi:hypothetical protein
VGVGVDIFWNYDSMPNHCDLVYSKWRCPPIKEINIRAFKISINTPNTNAPGTQGLKDLLGSVIVESVNQTMSIVSKIGEEIQKQYRSR